MPEYRLLPADHDSCRPTSRASGRRRNSRIGPIPDFNETLMNLDLLTDRMEEAFLKLSADDDASHDLHHSRRVKCMAMTIARQEDAGNPAYLIAAAYLHDIVSAPKNSPLRARASRLSAEAAAPILRDEGFGESDVEAVRHIIIAHSFSADIRPETIEARIFQDADRIDALGAIGIARTFFVAGKLGAALVDGGDPFARARQLDDRQFAVDHFGVKLLRLPDTMQTETGRRIARQRAETMRQFLHALGDELGHPSAW